MKKMEIQGDTCMGSTKGRGVGRSVALALLSLGIVIGANSAALASPGCTALNGMFSGGVVTGTITAGGFSAGDIITLTMTNSAGGDTMGLGEYNPGFTARLPNSSVTGTRTYTVPANTSNDFTISGSGFDSATIYSWSCMSGNTDSQKLRGVQILGSTMVAQASGMAISTSVIGAIGDAFGNGGNPVTVGPNGITLNFAAEPQAAGATRSPFAGRNDEAFSALAYAAGRNITKAPPLSPVFDRRWSAWLDVRGSGWDKSSTVDGNQINLTGGVGYKVAPNVLIGVFGGYEDFRYNFASLSGKLKGDGGTVGGYAAWQIAPTLRWDAMLGWSSISYDASAGTASGNFDGSRWLVSTGLTGFYRYAAYIIEPSAKVYALWEQQDAWTDSLGTLQADRSFSTGRVSLGGRVIAPTQYSAFSLAPYLGFYGDWRFSSDDALPVSVPNVGLVDGWSGRTTAGVSMTAPGGGTLSLGGEYGGLGAGYSVWTANARALWPF